MNGTSMNGTGLEGGTMNRPAPKESKPERNPRRVRLPGFLKDEDVGLGDVIKRATSSVGIRPCGGCAARAQRLNNWLVFSGRRQGKTRGQGG